MSYPRLSPEERHKLARSARAKSAARNAALRVGVMGGASPGQGTAAAAAPYYEIPAADREVLEAALDQTRSADPSVAGRARNALKQGFEAVKPDTFLGAIMRASPLVSGIIFLRAFFAGLRVRGEFNFSEGAVIFEGYLDETTAGTENRGLTLVRKASYDSATGAAKLEVTGAGAPVGCGALVGTPGKRNWGWKGGRAGLSTGEAAFSFESNFALTTSLTGNYDGESCDDALAWVETQGYHTQEQSASQTLATGRALKLCGHHIAADGLGYGWSCRELGPLDTPLPTYDVGPHEHHDTDEEPDVIFNKEETTQLIECLKDPSCSGDWDRPDPCEPSPPPGGGGPGGYDPPGWDPPGGGGPIGGGPGGGYDPYDPGEPGGYEDPGAGDGYGTFDPGRETCITFREVPAGFNDPSQPGGIARRYQPGQRATVRSGGTDRAADAVERADTQAACWDALFAAGWRGRTNDAAERLYPPYDFIKRSGATDQLWNCLLLLGWTLREAEEDVEVVNETALYRPGAPDVYTGKIKRVKRLPGGGVRICFHSPIEDKPVPEKICFRGKVVDAISSVLSQMGVENVIIDSECTALLFPQVCFPAGTPLSHILNYLLDLCGFCVFPQFDGNVLVGFCEPLNVHWHYHEDVDLIGFDLEYGNEEIPAIVEVFRPDKISRAGRIIEEGYSYPYPVQSAVATNGDTLRIEVPYGTTDAQVRAIAHSRARRYANQALPLTGFAVPLNSKLKLRHQIHIQRPSLGFKGVYMVTRLARDYDEKAFLNLGMGRWLRGSGG